MENPHDFRQTHVASNIEFYMANGLSIPSESYSRAMSDRVYDFPLYQHMVATLSRLFDGDPVVTGRLINVTCYLMLSAILFFLLSALEVKDTISVLSVWIVAISPLHTYYSTAVIPDNLAILFSFASLFFFVKDHRSPRPAWRYYVLFVGFGVLAALVKNPIYLPIVIATTMFLISRKDFATLLSIRFVAYLLVIGLTVVAFKVYSNHQNVGRFSTPRSEWIWYFGDLSERLQLGANLWLVKNLSEVATWPFLLIVPAGLVLFVKNERNFSRHMMLGLATGSFVTVMLFFHLMFIHNYYLLPTTFIIAFFAAYALDRGVRRLGDGLRRTRLRWRSHVRPEWTGSRADPALGARLLEPGLMLAIIVAGTILANGQRIGQGPDWDAVNAGLFIANNTEDDALVFYIVDDDLLDPTNTKYLYFAKRTGDNVTSSEALQETWPDRVREALATHRPVYLFVGRAHLALLDRLTAAVAGHPVARGDHGVVYRVTG
ncbi:MAG: DUF2142 domain-containing protein [Alphaproteobacteria bacterium]